MKCGTDVSFKNDRLGCNFLVYKKQARDMNRYLKSSRKTYKSFKNFPVCHHNLKAKLRVTSENAKNPKRAFFACNASPPDKSCGYFKWFDVDAKRMKKWNKKKEQTAPPQHYESNSSSDDDDDDQSETLFLTQRRTGKKVARKNKSKTVHQEEEDGNESSNSLFTHFGDDDDEQ